MTPEDHERLSTAFLRAIRVGSPNRETLVDEFAAAHPALSDRLRQMIHIHGQAEGESSEVGLRISGTDFVAAEQETVPDRIAGYRIKQPLGRGSMGTVYLAEQSNPRREVALKVMRQGLFHARSLERFEFEVEALARLRHAGIAHLYEAGVVEMDRDKTPFFAMELVTGLPLVLHADSQLLTTSDRVRLMIRVCEAVHHAHLHGIIHRDLKPANILVVESEPGDSDTIGHPKVLDFSVARLVRPDANANATAHAAEAGQIIGTIAYMSPEQVAADPTRIDFRSDVYALGVLLYELLSGELPFDVRGVPMSEAVRILEECPARPLSAENRALSGDLERIVNKAMHHEPDARYQTASAVADDLQRYLGRLPIAAREPTPGYTLKMFARRNPSLTAVSLLTLFVLVLGIAGTTWGLLEAGAQRDMANAQRDEAVEQWRVNERFNAFLSDDLIGQLDPLKNPAREPTFREAVDLAEMRISNRFRDDPTVEASIRTALGAAYRGLGDYVKSERQLDRAIALQEAHRAAHGEGQRLKTRAELAEVYQLSGRDQQALDLLRDVYDECRDVLGIRHPITVATASQIGLVQAKLEQFDAAEQRLIETVAVCRMEFGVDDPLTNGAITDLGSLYLRMGRYADAEPLFREAVDTAAEHLGAAHPRTIVAIDNLGEVLRRQAKYELAEVEMKRGLVLWRETFGPDHPDVLLAQNNLGLLYIDMHRTEDAIELLEAAADGFRRTLGHHEWTIMAVNNLALLRQNQGRLDDATRLFGEAIESYRELNGPEHSTTALATFNLGHTLARSGRFADAEPLIAEAIRIVRKALPADHWYLGQFLCTQGECLIALDRPGEAQPVLDESEQILEAAFPPEHPRVLRVKAALARLATSD